MHYLKYPNILQQIHHLVMCLNFNGIEIKSAQSLESWNGGVLVMVSGYVQLKEYSVRRKFVETFFLAPQEKGYFVLNDIFHLLEEEHIHQHPTVILAHSNLDTNLNAPSSVPETGNDYCGKCRDQPYLSGIFVASRCLTCSSVL